ncbi:hypothetical protein [Kitasatospora viridis]|uniref:Uncharacterized protein n=1 Tax=Kitasatospora viridis TaxID=281105 RepID=A0A561SER1_9ACTN|nr:hypothetical protein [Kitasatospora viridis]TWF73361.1 hypothetical protein FHX73_16512 [Kitasatospora viridis]
MVDSDVERTEERGQAAGPWWAELGTWGAVALIVLGGVAAVWVSFRLPGTPEELASGYYQAARVVAIGVVTVGVTLLGRRRARAAAVEDASE